MAALEQEFEALGLFRENIDEPCLFPAFKLELKPGSTPKSSPPRRYNPVAQAAMKTILDEMLRDGVISEFESDWAAPVVMARKKNEDDGGRKTGWRFATDYRLVNECTIDNKWPMKNPREILARMSGMRIYATIDLRSGFWQVRVNEETKRLLCFSTPFGLYTYNRMPMGVKQAPGHFQRWMSEALKGLEHCCEVYIDDVTVWAPDEESFLRDFRAVLTRLHKAGLRLKRKKCHFGLGQVECLGFVVNGEGTQLSPLRLQGLRDIVPPKDTSTVRSYMGMTNYLRDYIPDFAIKARPLTMLCSAKVPFVWGPEQQHAFRQLQDALLAAPVLHHLDYRLPIIVRSDASLKGVGAVLLQVVDGQERAVAYRSRAFTGAAKNWSTIEQEAYGVYFAIVGWEHLLLGQEFHVQTDHRNLMYIEKSVVPKIVRWRLRLQEYDFKLTHVAGTQNQVADALSRCLIAVATDTKRAKFDDVHNNEVGHHGVWRTVKMIRDHLTTDEEWSSVQQDVRNFIKECAACQKLRLNQGSVIAAQSSMDSYEPFQMIHVDCIGPFPAA